MNESIYISFKRKKKTNKNRFDDVVGKIKDLKTEIKALRF